MIHRYRGCGLVQDNLCDMGQARAVFPGVVTAQ
jgi:hypothetical protein